MQKLVWCAVPFVVFAIVSICIAADDSSPVAYWKLSGDCKDHSGNGLHGINHGVDLATSEFDGRGAYIEVPNAPSLKVGDGNLTFAAEIYTEKGIDDYFGDIFSKFDSATRK